MGHPFAGPKSFNNYLIALRGIFALEYSGSRAVLNPMNGIKNQKLRNKKPDPLSSEERDKVLEDMRTHYDPRVHAYFTFAFYTGMRPEEMIALQWGDIDFNAATARVQRVRTFQGSEREGDKVGGERDVDLVAEALAALAAVKPYTFLKRGPGGRPADIFENPITGAPWHDERSQRDTFWKPSLKRCGIRERRAYLTRSTYATIALMGGANPAYLSSQMGHTTPAMLFQKYARWINGADQGAARKMLQMALRSGK